MTYVVANRVFVKPEYADEFEQRFNNRVGQIDQQPGFVLMEVLKPRSDDTPYVVLTHWQDEQAFQNWVGSDDFKLAHQNPMAKELAEKWRREIGCQRAIVTNIRINCSLTPNFPTLAQFPTP
jgi:heme-degrading monooxygenase HmoA